MRFFPFVIVAALGAAGTATYFVFTKKQCKDEAEKILAILSDITTMTDEAKIEGDAWNCTKYCKVKE
jgi:hypothetical protein